MKCEHCGYEWIPRILEPMFCPRCKCTVSERGRKYKRDYYSGQYVGTRIDGKYVLIKTSLKRGKPDSCELCGRVVRRLNYHHWDNSDLSKGVWLCGTCHYTAEASDKGMAEKYTELKGKIEQQSASITGQAPAEHCLPERYRLYNKHSKGAN